MMRNVSYLSQLNPIVVLKQSYKSIKIDTTEQMDI